MYKNMLVAAIKVDGKVCREIGETVRIPFGSEYQIFLKNLNTLDVVVDITIDGKSVTHESLYIAAGTEATIERPVSKTPGGNRFKFIAMTDQIADHRGVEAEDGLISISFRFAKYARQVFRPNIWGNANSPWDANPYYHKGSPTLGAPVRKTFGGEIVGGLGTGDAVPVNMYSTCDAYVYSDIQASSTRSATMDYHVVDAKADLPGITVAGSISTQEFVQAPNVDLQDEMHVMVFRMTGFNDDSKTVPVKQAYTVEVKKYCHTCGKKAKPVDKFCGNCGTSLESVKV